MRKKKKEKHIYIYVWIPKINITGRENLWNFEIPEPVNTVIGALFSLDVESASLFLPQPTTFLPTLGAHPICKQKKKKPETLKTHKFFMKLTAIFAICKRNPPLPPKKSKDKKKRERKKEESSRFHKLNSVYQTTDLTYTLAIIFNGIIAF